MEIRISEKEQKLLKNHLSRSTNYLEYGSGGSTALACSISNIEKIHSVESDLSFIKEISKEDSVAKNIQSKRLKFYFANLGETGRWGVPVNNTKMHLWPLYPLMPFADSKEKTNYDLVLIDGRFRVACAIAVALENPNCVILMHDYFKRPQYWILERFYKVVDRADTLAELHLNKDIDSKLLTKTFRTFCYMPDDKKGLYRLKMVRNLIKQFRKNGNKE